MFYVLATVFLGGLALLAPRFAVVAIALSLVVTLTVKFVARFVTRVEPTLGESFRAVCYGIGLAALVLAVLLGASHGNLHVQDSQATFVLGLLLAAYVAGFKGALGTGWRASSVVAIAATFVSAGFLYSVRDIA